MRILFFVALIVLALGCCDLVYIYSLKERYKKWYQKLFQKNEKPTNWGLSRITNHNRYVKSCKTLFIALGIFLVASILSWEEIAMNLMGYVVTFIVIIALSCVIGWIIGRSACDKEVLEQCDKCGVDKVALWKNPQVFLEIFLFYRFMFSKP